MGRGGGGGKYLYKTNQFFHNGGPYHKEISPLISSANQRTGLYMIGNSVMRELINSECCSNSFTIDFDQLLIEWTEAYMVL